MIFCLASTHIRTLEFRPHAHRTHMCVLPKFDSHTHVYSKRKILKQILHFLCTFLCTKFQFKHNQIKYDHGTAQKGVFTAKKVQNQAFFTPKRAKNVRNCDRKSHTRKMAARMHIARTLCKPSRTHIAHVRECEHVCVCEFNFATHSLLFCENRQGLLL